MSSDVFVRGEAGYFIYCVPAIVTAPDGSLIAFAEARKHPGADPGGKNQEIDLVYKRTTDQGATWSPMVVLEHAGTFWSAANPATLVDRDNGRVWVFYVRCRPGATSDAARPGTDDAANLARWSGDNGRSWSEPIDLTSAARDLKDPAWRISVPGPGGAIQTRAGRLLVAMWKFPFADFAMYSDDHGQTWQRGGYVPGKQGGDECQVAELDDGRILIDCRQETGATRWLAESSDGGVTWGRVRPGVTVSPVACALERYAPAGGGRSRLLWTGPKGPERRRLRMLTSEDDGKTFAHERLISEDYAAYSDLTILKDQSVGVLWERGVKHGYQFMTFTRLDRAWLEEGHAGPEPPAPKVISRGEAAGTYQAFTDICRLKNGDLFCVFYAGYGHVSLPQPDFPKGGRICYVRSGDEGRTWTAPRVLYDGPFDDRDPHIAQMRDGSVVCSFFTYRPQPGNRTPYDTCLVTSRDGGATWDTEPRIVAPEWPSSAPVRELPDGTRILGVYREEGWEKGDTAYGGIIRSTDGGKTWCAPIPIGRGSGVRLDAETDFVLLKDGTLYAALRGDDRVNMHFATSPDAGLTWSRVQDIGFPGHCPHLNRLSTGEILLSHRPAEDVLARQPRRGQDVARAVPHRQRPRRVPFHGRTERRHGPGGLLRGRQEQRHPRAAVQAASGRDRVPAVGTGAETGIRGVQSPECKIPDGKRRPGGGGSGMGARPDWVSNLALDSPAGVWQAAATMSPSEWLDCFARSFDEEAAAHEPSSPQNSITPYGFTTYA